MCQVQSRLTGHHEIVQPGRVKLRGRCVSNKPVGRFRFLFNLPEFLGMSLFLLQIFLKEGVLNKLSRKDMQPRMFFLVLREKTPLPSFTAYVFFSFFLGSSLLLHSSIPSQLVEALKAQSANEITKKSDHFLPVICERTDRNLFLSFAV